MFSLLNVAVQSNFMLHKESSFALTKTSNQRDHKPQRDEVTAETNRQMEQNGKWRHYGPTDDKKLFTP